MKKFVSAAVVVLLAALSAFAFDSFGDSFSVRSSKSWRWTNPSGDCTFRMDTGRGMLVLAVPSGEHDLWKDSNLNAPRLTQTVTGDFSVETKLDGKFKYDFQSAGLVVWQDDTHFVRLERMFYSATNNGVQIEGIDGGAWKTIDRVKFPESPVYLRVERRGDAFHFYYSRNGQYWEVMDSAEFKFGPSVSVGLFAANQWQDNPLEVSFDFFRYHTLQ